MVASSGCWLRECSQFMKSYQKKRGKEEGKGEEHILLATLPPTLLCFHPFFPRISALDLSSSTMIFSGLQLYCFEGLCSICTVEKQTNGIYVITQTLYFFHFRFGKRIRKSHPRGCISVHPFLKYEEVPSLFDSLLPVDDCKYSNR
jgi:hypothetical protein